MVEVMAPRVDDCRSGECYGSLVPPAYRRKSPKVAEVLPVMHLRGLSTGGFGPPSGVLRREGRVVSLHGRLAHRTLV